MKHDGETVDSEGFLIVNNSWLPLNFTGKVKLPNETKRWYKYGKLHREDGPAIVWDDGTNHWYKDGHLHRDNGPAVEFAHGDKWWYRNGQLHREDGPAIENVDGSVTWYYNGKHGLENFPPELKKKLARKFIHEA